MGPVDAISVAQKMAHRDSRDTVPGRSGGKSRRYDLIVLLFAAVTFFSCIVSPPSLMDDVDAVQAQIARNMLDSGDWVTAMLDGIAYLEKSPLKYWMIAVCFKIFGVHDWAARIPIAISVVLLCLVAARFARWALGDLAGLYAGVILATCIGIFLFTRVLIPDVVLTLTITVAMWAFLRLLDNEEARPGLWAMVFWGAMAVGLLLKGLIALVFPVGAAIVFLAITGKFRQRRTWRSLRILPGCALFLAIAAPWHILATLRNPPYFDFTMHSEPGSYRGFFWFYFINEHLLRFLNRRYPRDYNTVPRAFFWLFHLLWLFPWSVYFGSVVKLRFRGNDRASQMQTSGSLLGGIRAVLLHLLDHAGVLLDARISGAGAVTRRRDDFARSVAAPCHQSRGRNCSVSLWGNRFPVVASPISSCTGRYFGRADVQPGCLYALAGPHGGFDVLRIRLLATAAGDCRRGNSGGSDRRLVPAIPSRDLGFGSDDGVVLPGRKSGARGLRSIPEYPAARRGTQSGAGRQTDRGRSVLYVLIHVLLQQPDCADYQWPSQ